MQIVPHGPLAGFAPSVMRGSISAETKAANSPHYSAPTEDPAGLPGPTAEATAPASNPAGLNSDQLFALQGEDSPGKSAQSPAHRARAAIEANPALADLPFGQIVSRLARGLELPTVQAADPAVTEDPTAPADQTPPSDQTAAPGDPASPGATSVDASAGDTGTSTNSGVTETTTATTEQTPPASTDSGFTMPEMSAMDTEQQLMDLLAPTA
jgi:hypothetical protein